MELSLRGGLLGVHPKVLYIYIFIHTHDYNSKYKLTNLLLSESS